MTKNSVPLGKLLIDAHFITGVKLSSWESRDKKNQDNLNRIGAKFLEMVEPVKAPEQEPDFDALDTITEAEGSWGFNSMGERYRFKTRGEAITLQKYFASGRIFDEAKRVKVKHYPEVWTDQLIWTDKGVDYGSRDGLLPPEDNDNWDVSLIEGDVTDRLYSKDPETEASAILKEGFDLESDLDPVEAARKAVEAHEQLASILEEADERLVSAFGIGDGHRDSIDSIDLAKTVEEAIATYQAVGAKNASISATRPDRSAEEAIAYAAQLETLFEPIRKALGAKEGETILAAAERLGKEKGVQSESPMGFLAGLIGMSALGGVALGAKAKPTRVALPAKTVQGLAEDDVQEKEELNAISNGH